MNLNKFETGENKCYETLTFTCISSCGLLFIIFKILRQPPENPSWPWGWEPFKANWKIFGFLSNTHIHIHSLSHPLAHLFNHRNTHSPTHSSTYPITSKITHSHAHPPTRPTTHSLIHSVTLTHSLTHAYSLTHSLFCLS